MKTVRRTCSRCRAKFEISACHKRKDFPRCPTCATVATMEKSLAASRQETRVARSKADAYRDALRKLHGAYAHAMGRLFAYHKTLAAKGPTDADRVLLIILEGVMAPLLGENDQITTPESTRRFLGETEKYAEQRAEAALCNEKREKREVRP